MNMKNGEVFAPTGKLTRLHHSQLSGVQPVYGSDLGITGDGSDETALLKDAITEANAQNKPLNLEGLSVVISEEVTLPNYGLHGTCSITGGTLKVYRNRVNFQQREGKLTCDTFHISGCQYGYFENIRASAINIDGGSEVGESGFGVFWCHFGQTNGLITINTDKHSINQNLFLNHRGGLHVTGGAGSTFPNECNQNRWCMIDTTGTQIPDGGSDAAILNDSDSNQTNIIEMWYSEGAGTGIIRGNWDLMSSYFDGATSPYALEHTNHVMNNPDTSSRNRGDFLAAGITNLAAGGCWDILNMDDKGQPLSYSATSNAISAMDVVADATDPMGIGYKYGGTVSASYSHLSVNLPPVKSGTGYFSIYLWVQGDTPANISMTRDSTDVSCGNTIFHEGSNGWKLYRISTSAASGKDNTLKVYFNTSGSSSKTTYLGGCWATDLKTALLPHQALQSVVSGVCTGTPVDAISLPVGGNIKNTAPSNGSYLEWTKTSDGIVASKVQHFPVQTKRYSGDVPQGVATTLFEVTESVYIGGAGIEVDIYWLNVKGSPDYRGLAGKQKALVGLWSDADSGNHHSKVSEIGSALINHDGTDGTVTLSSTWTGSAYAIQATTAANIGTSNFELVAHINGVGHQLV